MLYLQMQPDLKILQFTGAVGLKVNSILKHKLQLTITILGMCESHIYIYIWNTVAYLRLFIMKMAYCRKFSLLILLILLLGLDYSGPFVHEPHRDT